MAAITSTCTGGEKFNIAIDVVGKISSGDCGMTEKPSNKDDPNRSEESAGLSNVGGTPSIWAMTQKHRQRTISRRPFERLEYNVAIIESNHTDSDPA